jgi:hypothetical protein
VNICCAQDDRIYTFCVCGKNLECRRDLFFLEVGAEGGGFAVVETEAAGFGGRVFEGDVQSGRCIGEGSGFHGGADQVMGLVIFGADCGVFADDESPVFLAGNDVDGVSAERDLDVVEDQRGLHEENGSGAAGHPYFAVLRFFFMRGAVLQADLIVVGEIAVGGHGLRIIRGLLRSRHGEQKWTK